jgi:cyclic pyranopterin phosphate synthase
MANMSFTHLDEQGRAKMVDISDKQVTLRKAVAAGEVRCRPDTAVQIVSQSVKKGDVFAVSRVAGIMAAKKTAELIPLCHGIPINSVEIEIGADAENGVITVIASVVTEGKTGIEMEALTAVSGTCLCIYDMCKAIDKDMVIGNIRLLSKSGGRSGDYIRTL